MTSRTALAPAGHVTLYSLGSLGTAFLWTFWLDHQLYDQFVWPVLVLALIALAAAGLVATTIRWMLPVGAIVGAGIFATALMEPFIIMRLTAPETVWAFVSAVLIVGLSATATVAGSVATVRGRRTTPDVVVPSRRGADDVARHRS